MPRFLVHVEYYGYRRDDLQEYKIQIPGGGKEEKYIFRCVQEYRISRNIERQHDNLLNLLPYPVMPPLHVLDIVLCKGYDRLVNA